ncbi:SDR family NAD(P)-dependent oxidoreductase [Nitrospinota bacterium]
MELEGKVALITGGAQGIGADTARKFVAEGAEVSVVDIQGEKLASLEGEGGGAILGVEADVGSGEGIEHAFDETVKRFGGIDLLINCAIERGNMPLDAIDEKMADLVISVGLKSCILSAQRAAREMRKRGGGAIVSMSSFYARTPVAGRVLYVSVKAGVEGLTRALAVELAPDNIRVNTIAAGPVLTEKRRAEGQGDPANLAERYRKAPMPRFARVEEVVDGMLYLVTPRSSYMTGQVIVLDGGLTIA